MENICHLNSCKHLRKCSLWKCVVCFWYLRWLQEGLWGSSSLCWSAITPCSSSSKKQGTGPGSHQGSGLAWFHQECRSGRGHTLTMSDTTFWKLIVYFICYWLLNKPVLVTLWKPDYIFGCHVINLYFFSNVTFLWLLEHCIPCSAFHLISEEWNNLLCVALALLKVDTKPDLFKLLHSYNKNM